MAGFPWVPSPSCTEPGYWARRRVMAAPPCMVTVRQLASTQLGLPARPPTLPQAVGVFSWPSGAVFTGSKQKPQA